MKPADLHEILEPIDPCVTVYVDSSRAEELAPDRIRLRWQELADRLREAGAEEPDVEATRDAVLANALADTGSGAAPGPAAVLVAARHGEVLLTEGLPTPPANGIGDARLAPVPDVVPLLRDLARRIPYLVIRADRTGGTVEAYEAAAPLDAAPASGEPAARAESERNDLHVHKTGGGGWAHHRMQHHVEDHWLHSAHEVAGLVDELARRFRPAFAVLAADPKVRPLVAGPISEPLEVVEVDAEVTDAGASREPIERAVHERLERLLDAHRQEVTGRLLQRLGTQQPGEPTDVARDLPTTVAALQQAQVGVLLLRPEEWRGSTVHIGTAPTDVALAGTPQPWPGEATPCPADLALIRSAVLTGADVELLTDPAPVTVGALLRGPV